MTRRSRRYSTVPSRKPPRAAPRPSPPRGAVHPPPPRTAKPSKLPPRRDVARIVDQAEASLLDVIDNLLSKGVVINADVILALADVDLIYVRLSALLVAADRLLPTDDAR